MGYQDHRARKSDQGLLEDLCRWDVEVIRGLIEKEKIARFEQELGKREATLLAARERGHVAE